MLDKIEAGRIVARARSLGVGQRLGIVAALRGSATCSPV
jgi:hypothetical protein